MCSTMTAFSSASHRCVAQDSQRGTWAHRLLSVRLWTWVCVPLSNTSPLQMVRLEVGFKRACHTLLGGAGRGGGT